MKKINQTYDDLPFTHKQALLTYCDMTCETLEEVKELYKERLFTVEIISIEEAKKRCMEHMAEWSGHKGKSFEEFHVEYIGDGSDIPNHGDSVYPVIEGGIEEWLDDGWHRFASYVLYNHTEIPVLRIQHQKL